MATKWDGKLAAAGGHDGEIHEIALSGDGRLAASGDWQGTILLWRLPDGEEIARISLGDDDAVRQLVFRPGGEDLLVVGEKGLAVFTGERNRLSLDAAGGRTGVFLAAFSPDGRRLATACDSPDGVHLGVYETAGYCLENKVLFTGLTVDDLAGLRFSADSLRLQLWDEKARLALWDLAAETWDGRPLRETEQIGAEVFVVVSQAAQLMKSEYLTQVFLPAAGDRIESRPLRFLSLLDWNDDKGTLAENGEWALVASEPGVMAVWDIAAQKKLDFLLRHEGEITAACVSADGCWAATGDSGGRVRLWDMQNRREQCSFLCGKANIFGNAGVQRLEFSPDSAWLAAGWRSGGLQVWSVADGSLLQDLPGHEDTIHLLSASPDGRRLLSGDFNGTYRIWQIEAGKAITAVELAGTSKYFNIQGLAWLPGGEQLAVSGDNGHVWLVRLDNGSVAADWEMEPGLCPGRLAASPAGGLLAIQAGRSKVLLWDIAVGREIAALDHPEGRVAMVFDRDGALLATGDSHGKLRLWDTTCGKLCREWSLPGSVLSIASFSGLAGGFSAVVAQTELRCKRLDAAEGRTYSFVCGVAPEQCAVSADGRHVAAGFHDGRLLVWTPETNAIGEFSTGPEYWSRAWNRPGLWFSPDGKHLSALRQEDGAWLWSEAAAAFRPLPRPAQPPRQPQAAGFSASGLLFVSYTDHTELRDAATLELRCEFRGYLRSLAPDLRKALLIDEATGLTRIVDFDALRELKVFARNELPAHSLYAWSADSSVVCVGHDERRPQFVNLAGETGGC